MAITGKLLEKEGVYLAESVSAKELASLPPVNKAQIAESLSGLLSDFVFFNHGLLFTAAGFYHDPVEEFMLKKGDIESIFALEYNKMLFRGINFKNNPDDSWNKILLGCRAELWPELYQLLNTIIATCSITNKVSSCFMSCAYMPDPNAWNGSTSGLKVSPSSWGRACERADMGMNGDPKYAGVQFPEGIPFIKVFVAGVSGPDGLSYIKSGIRPTVMHEGPEESAIKLQEAIAKNDL